MAYNNPQYSGYVSTSANTQAVQQGLAASTARQAQLMQARQQQELKEKKAANAKIEKQKEIKTAAFNNNLAKAVSTGKVTDVEGAFGGLRDKYYDLVQQYGNEDANKTTLDFEMSKILGMIPAFVTNMEGQGVDVEEYKTAEPGEIDPAMDPSIGLYLDTIGQSDGHQPSQYDEDGNLTVGGYDITYEADTETATWNTIVTKTELGKEPVEIRTVNSGAYSLNPEGMFNKTEGPLNTQTEIATGINLFGINSNGEVQEGVLNGKYVQEFIRTGEDGFKQRVQTANTVLIKADAKNATDVQASSYLVDSATAATAWNNNFIRTIPQNIQETLDLEDKRLAAEMGKQYNIEIGNGGDAELLQASMQDQLLLDSQAFKNKTLIEAELNPKEYEMWSGDQPITPEQIKLMKEGTMRSFMDNNKNLFEEKLIGSSERPYKGDNPTEVSKQLAAFRELSPQVKANNVNGKAAFWTLSEDKTAYELRQYNEIGDSGLFDMQVINGFAPIPVGDETAFNAAF
jgi:hypothetical protein